MVSVSIVDEINALQEDDQAIILGLIKSLTRRNQYRTDARRRFEEECKYYEGRNLSMDEIDALIQEARSL